MPTPTLRACARLISPLYFSTCIAASVSAQDTPLLEEVIITAQKREQPLQTVPVAVTAINGDEIRNLGIGDVFDLQINVPGLVVDANQSATTSNFAIRGIGTNSQNFGLEPAVGLYVDGVYRARQSAMINELIDIEWVEILRGPQGTLFGRNSSAGAILVNSTPPDHEGSGFVEVTAGNYDLMKINAAQSVSVIRDVLALRLTGFFTQRDGWMDDISLEKDNAINDRDRFGLRLQALFTPNEDLELRLIADHAEIDEHCCGTSVVYDNNEIDQRIDSPNSGMPGTDALLEARGGTFIPGSRTFDRITAYNHLPISRNEDSGLSLQIDWTLDTATLTSISAYRQFDSYDNIDSDFTDLDVLNVINDAEQSSFSQELRIAGLSAHFNYVAGVYLFMQELDSTQILEVGEDTAAVAAVNQPFTEAVLLPLFPADAFATTINAQDHQAWAVFGQMDFPLGDRLILTTGLRYTDEHKELDATYTETNAPALGLGLNLYAPLASREDIDNLKLDDEQTTGTLKLSWNLTDNALLYWSYATGYKAGGTNTDRIFEPPPGSELNNEGRGQTFKAETTQSLEAGIKAEIPQHALRINIALHKTEVDDLQVNTFDGTGFNMRNAGKVDSYGGEVELLWMPDSDTIINLSYAKTIADFKDFATGNCWLASPFRGIDDPGRAQPDDSFCSRDGDRIGTNPEDFLSLTLRKNFPVSATVDAYLITEYIYTGDQMMEASNDPLEFQDSYVLLNMRLGLVIPQWQSEVIFWGRNITDTDYYGTNFDPPLQDGKLTAYARDPATWGITYRFSY